MRKNGEQATKTTIHCPGSFSIQPEKKEVILCGTTEQVFIEDVVGEIYADCVKMQYNTPEQEQFIPEKIILEGNVKIFSRLDSHPQGSDSSLHYALAPMAEYFPPKQEMILTGTTEHRVLFFDQVHHMQMSALSLVIKKDPVTEKNSIQATGDVRCIFSEQELQQLKKHFRL